MIIAVIVLGVLCAVLAAVALRRPAAPGNDANAALLLKQDLSKLSDDITRLKDGLQTQITERLDKNQELMRDSITKQFSASSRLIADVTERLIIETEIQVLCLN